MGFMLCILQTGTVWVSCYTFCRMTGVKTYLGFQDSIFNEKVQMKCAVWPEEKYVGVV